jgi:alkanesulfonate monooxygenase
MTNNTTGDVQIIGMIGVTQETPENAGASLSVFGGGINPGGEVPAGVDPDYIVEFALSHERSGFDMVLTGYSSTTPDGFEIAGYAAAHTRKLGYLIAHRPGFISPTLAARKIATLDQLTRGRVALHIISGGSDAEQQQDGDWLDHDSRYRRTDEYMTVLKNMWLKNEASDFEGEFYSYKGAHCKVTCYQKPHVPLFFGGASEIAARIGSRQADYYAFLGEPLGVITDRVNVLKEQAKQCDNHIEFSISFRPILGATEEEAWSKAFSILERVKKSTDGKILPGETSRAQSTLSQRLVNFSTDKDIYDERLWMPIAYASGGAGNTTCLVGTPEQVVDSLMKYYRVGCTAFILRGFDPLNDAKEYGKQLIPLLRERVESYNRVS